LSAIALITLNPEQFTALNEYGNNLLKRGIK